MVVAEPLPVHTPPDPERLGHGALAPAVRLVVARGLLPIAIGNSVALLSAVSFSGLLEAYLWGIAGTRP